MNQKDILLASNSILAMLGGILAFFIQSITPLFFILIFLMFIDYITGLSASYYEGKWSSKSGWNGAIKKFTYFVLVIICMFADYSVSYLSSYTGLVLGFTGIFTLLIICWLIGVELLSIIENLGRLNAPIPPFLRKAFAQFKTTAEKIGDLEVDDFKTGENHDK